MTRFKYMVLCLVTPFILILDQISKAFIVKYLPLGGKFTIWPFFDIVHVRNRGAALGNVSDRVFRGSVVDFLSFHWYDLAWPSFNVADSAISVGVVGLMIAMMRESKTQKGV